MINNRKVIESRCNERNLNIHSLEYIRSRDAQYGDSWDASYWELSIYLSESKIETYDTSLGDSIEQGIAVMGAERLRFIMDRIFINTVGKTNPCSEVSTGVSGKCVLPHGDIPSITAIKWRHGMIGGIIDIDCGHVLKDNQVYYACITYTHVYIYPYVSLNGYGEKRTHCTNHTLLANLRTEIKRWMKSKNMSSSDKDNAAVNAVARIKKILNNMIIPIEVSEHPPFTPSMNFTIYQNDPVHYRYGLEYLNSYHRYDVYTQMNLNYMSKFEITCIRVFGIESRNSAFYVTKDNIQYEHSHGGNNASRSEMRLLLRSINKDLTLIKAKWHKLTRITDHVDSLDEMVLFKVKEWVESKLYDFTGHSIEFNQVELENTVTYKAPEGVYKINLREQYGTYVIFLPKDNYENEMQLSRSEISSLVNQLNDWITSLSRHDNVKEAVYAATTVQRAIDIVEQIHAFPELGYMI